MNKNRITGKKQNIDLDSVSNFFDARAKVFKKENPLTSVLYQDSNPEIAKARDKYEKEIATPLLHLDGTQSLLDIGCGIGRWAMELEGKVRNYVGVDFSNGLIEHAKQLCNNENVQFFVAGADQLDNKSVVSNGPFDRFIISGLIIYLNDDQVSCMFQQILNLASPNAEIYIREPLATTQRLTLNNFWSDELQAHYSAIYRDVNEFKEMLELHLSSRIKDKIEITPLYKDDSLNNRAETKQYITVISLS